jgi:hypothetical protein
MENRNGLAVGATVTQAGYAAEREAAVTMVKELSGMHRKTVGVDKHYDQEKFCERLRRRHITPHVAQNLHARRFTSAVDSRTTRHAGYEVSQRKRKLVEEIFGWLKTISLIRRPHFRGRDKIDFAFTFALGVYNILRITNLTAETG